MSADELIDQYRRLADVVETVAGLEGVRVADSRGGGPTQGPEPFTAELTIAIASPDAGDDVDEEEGDTDSLEIEEAIEEANEDPLEVAEELRDNLELDEPSEESASADDESFECKECGDCFDSQRGLSIHQTRSHADDVVDAPNIEEIKALRERRNWTQADLAAELDVGNSTVANWETEVSRPSGESAERLRELYESLDENEPDADTDPEPEDSDTNDDLVSETDGGAVADSVDENADRDREDPPNLPSDTSVAAVEALVDEHQYLADVAAELSLTEGKTRALLVHIDRYSDVREGGRR